MAFARKHPHDIHRYESWLSNHDEGPGRIGKFQFMTDKKSLVNMQEPKMARPCDGRPLRVNHQNPYQFDTSILLRMENAKRKVVQQQEEQADAFSASMMAAIPPTPYSARSGSMSARSGMMTPRTPRMMPAPNTIIGIPNDLPGYTGHVPGRGVEGVFGFGHKRATQVSAQTRTDFGRVHDGARGRVPPPLPHGPSHILDMINGK